MQTLTFPLSEVKQGSGHSPAMPRPLGIAFEGAIYPAMNRGNRHEPILHDDVEGKLFLSTMRYVILLAALLLAPLAALHADDTPAKRPLLLANYYCWYHDGQHPKRPFLHWTYPSSETNALAKKAQKPGEPPPNSVFRPLGGLYDSADPKVAEWHVQLAKAAGIDAFLVDWWDTHNALDQNVDRGIVAAADIC
jgi:hypothetical protein